MIAESSPEKRSLFAPPGIKRKREITLDCNQNSMEDDSLAFNAQLPTPLSKNLVSHLSILNLSNSKLEDLSKYIFLPINLEHLKIDNCDISSLPLKICDLRNLKHLDASENKIHFLPEGLANLENLQNLNLSYNELSKLPSSCSSLNRLENLVISNNRFKFVPECIEEGMKNLQILDLSHNPLKFISPPASTKLKQFTAKGLKFCRLFPNWLLNPKFWRLEEIILDDSSFSKFSIRKDWISHLRSLSMSNCSLTDLTFQKITANMVELEKIQVDGNEVSREKVSNNFCFLPGSNLKNPGTVKEINVRCTGLSLLTHSVGVFCNLKRLDLGRNNIIWLPIEICELENLEVLIIDGSKLDSLPEKFGELRKLEEFVACNNRLSRLPESMGNLENLRILDLYNNEIVELPVNLSGEKLQCLDLEKNFVEINNPLMRNTPYDVLRERLRKHYNCQRDVGSKPDKEDDTYDFYEFKSSGSCSESESPKACRIPDSNGSCFQENWDFPEDSGDEYEPSREAKSKVPPARSLYQYHLNYSSYFRPADYHSQRICNVIKRMKKKGLKKNSTCPIVDGQFDDA